MLTLIHTAEGELKSDDSFTVPGTKVETRSTGELEAVGSAGTTPFHPGLITHRAAKYNQGLPKGSTNVAVIWKTTDVNSDRPPSLIERKKIKVVEEWTKGQPRRW